MKLGAGALLNAVFVSTVLLLFSAMILLLVHYFKGHNAQLHTHSRLLDNAASAIQLGMALDEAALSLDLYGEGRDSVSIKHYPWGVFTLLKVEAYSKQQSVSKRALVGAQPNPETALIMADHHKALYLCGATKIKGQACLPSLGVKRAYIEGKSFEGVELIDGEVLEAPQGLQSIDKRIAYYSLEDSEQLTVLPVSANYSFEEPTKYYYQSEPLYLSGLELEGNAIIESGREIVVAADCHLKTLLLIAPNIRLEEGFKGSLQLLVTDSLSLMQSVHLTYPSSIIARGECPKVELNKKSLLEGVLLIESSGNNTYKPNLSIARSALVKGEVYCEGKTELKGSVYGQLQTQQFVLHTPSAIYENHLLDATIDRVGLSPHFLGMDGANRFKGIAQWLD